MNQQIKGIPQGYTLLRVGIAKKGEKYINSHGNVSVMFYDDSLAANYLIVERIKPDLSEGHRSLDIGDEWIPTSRACGSVDGTEHYRRKILTLKIGGWYKDRNGRLVGPLIENENGNGNYPYRAIYSYTSKGKILEAGESPNDLIEEVETPFANAEEFSHHRHKWTKHKGFDSWNRITGYNDNGPLDGTWNPFWSESNMRIGIVIDSYKQATFERMLTEGGFTFETKELDKKNSLLSIFVDTRIDKFPALEKLIVKAHRLSKKSELN